MTSFDISLNKALMIKIKMKKFNKILKAGNKSSNIPECPK